MAKDLAERAENLPDTYRTLRSSAKDFADRIKKDNIPGLMKSGSTSAENQDGRQALHFATLALEALEKLMSDSCNGGGGFGDMTRGDMKFQVPKNLKQTMEQMLSALMSQGQNPGQGQGKTGAGSGLDGPADDGYQMGSYSPLNTPVFGPNRMSLPTTSTPGTAGDGRDVQGKASARITPIDSETIDTHGKSGIKSRSMDIESMPDKYKEAIKKYFGGNIE